MAINKAQLPSNSAVTGQLGIAGKTITSVTAFQHGSVQVVDIYCTDSTHYYIKFRCGATEVGGTADWGSGK